MLKWKLLAPSKKNNANTSNADSKVQDISALPFGWTRAFPREDERFPPAKLGQSDADPNQS